MWPLYLAVATATEVVWLEEPEQAEQIIVATAAGATGPPLTPLELRAAATRWSEVDEENLRALSIALSAARAYESTLDGELLILRDLQPLTAKVTALRDDADRNVLYMALLYQGFAVNRYFGSKLGSDANAEPFRKLVTRFVEAPWYHAAALEPTRSATNYEIGESPQRTVYEKVRQKLVSLAPATLTPAGLPGTARLIVDGRPTDINPQGQVKVRPGRHILHAEIDGHIVERWDIDATSGTDVPLLPLVDDLLWTRFLADPAGEPLAEPIIELVAAMGGEVWLATPNGPIWSITSTAVTLIDPSSFRAGRSTSLAPWLHRLSAGPLAGWLTSADFYAQAPRTVPRTVSSVNALAIGGWAEISFAVGPLNAGSGLDFLVPTGENHVAFSGKQRLRPRPIPYAAFGFGPVDVSAGWLFPYHPAVGLHLTQSLLPSGHLVVRGAGWRGFPLAPHRANGSIWQGAPIYTLTGGLGVGW